MTHWREVMPSIPLARNVPVLYRLPQPPNTVWVTYASRTVREAFNSEKLVLLFGDADRVRVADCIPDLNDPLGAYYALSWLWRSSNAEWVMRVLDLDDDYEWSVFKKRVLLQRLGDTHKLTLARACRRNVEVTP